MMLSLAGGDVTLRPITDPDADFLLRLYATTREAELEQVPWSPEQKAAFIHQQFWAQHTHWRENYTDTTWDVIVQDGVPIGRLYVARWEEEIRVVDIAVIPDHRGRGVGTALLHQLLEEADRERKKVSIHVEIYNPARHLYERLGFAPAGDRGVYLLMERAPAL